MRTAPHRGQTNLRLPWWVPRVCFIWLRQRLQRTIVQPTSGVSDRSGHLSSPRRRNGPACLCRAAETNGSRIACDYGIPSRWSFRNRSHTLLTYFGVTPLSGTPPARLTATDPAL